jgi:hypothetical protein
MTLFEIELTKTDALGGLEIGKDRPIAAALSGNFAGD